MALDYYNKALTIRKAKLGEEHTAVANLYACIGLVYCDKCNYDKTLEYLDKTLPIFLSSENKADEMIFLLYTMKALCYLKLGDTVKAKEYEKKATKIERRLK